MHRASKGSIMHESNAAHLHQWAWSPSAWGWPILPAEDMNKDEWQHTYISCQHSSAIHTHRPFNDREFLASSFSACKGSPCMSSRLQLVGLSSGPLWSILRLNQVGAGRIVSRMKRWRRPITCILSNAMSPTSDIQTWWWFLTDFVKDYEKSEHNKYVCFHGEFKKHRYELSRTNSKQRTNARTQYTTMCTATRKNKRKRWYRGCCGGTSGGREWSSYHWWTNSSFLFVHAHDHADLLRCMRVLATHACVHCSVHCSLFV